MQLTCLVRRYEADLDHVFFVRVAAVVLQDANGHRAVAAAVAAVNNVER